MAKFNDPVHVPIERTVTHEGAPAFVPPLLQELAFTAACTYVEDTFYETADQRTKRLIDLVRDATDRDPHAVAKFVTELRERYLIRSASIIVAAEYARCARERGYPKSWPAVRDVVSSALQRADEPAEFIAYWQTQYGRDVNGRRKASLPMGIRKGLADAVVRLFTPIAALKWNSHERRIRMGDVLELVHAIPKNDEQRALFRLVLDERHRDAWETGHPGNAEVLPLVPTIRDRIELSRVPEAFRRETLRQNPQSLWHAGFTWEHLSSWLPGGMDAEAWEAIIPRMGVMALIRNLRNFDDKSISDEVIDRVIAKITSAEDVEASKIMPYRAYTAYRNAPSDNWKRALGKTLGLASRNAPALDDSLILIDTSGSMMQHLSNKSVIKCVELAALQAMTIAKRSKNVDVALFADGSGLLDQWQTDWRRSSILKSTSDIMDLVGIVGGATYGHSAAVRHYDRSKHRQIVFMTDNQMWDDARLTRNIPTIITVNLAGYRQVSTWGAGRINVSGWSDQVFKVLSEILNDRPSM